jgi:chromosome segregation ATPase
MCACVQVAALTRSLDTRTQQLQQGQDELTASMSTAQEHAAIAKRLLPQLQKQSEQMQGQLHDHTARLAASADELHSQMATVQAAVGVAAATAAAELATACSELQGGLDTQAAVSRGLGKELESLKKATAAAAEAAAGRAAAAAAAASAMLVVQLQEHRAGTDTQLAALRGDLNVSVTNAKLEEELQFLSLHEQVSWLLRGDTESRS